jgi:hypothetical protein
MGAPHRRFAAGSQDRVPLGLSGSTIPLYLPDGLHNLIQGSFGCKFGHRDKLRGVQGKEYLSAIAFARGQSLKT